jgi:AbiU2
VPIELDGGFVDRYLSAEKVQKQHVKILGLELGLTYHALYNDCLWLHVKWRQYVELYGTKQERVDLLNRAAGVFFRIAQDTLYHDTLLHLCRLTDPTGKGKTKDNLTVKRLPSLISDAAFRAEIQTLVNEAVKATAFARDWRDRHIAHRDLALTLKKGAKPIATASRNDVNHALQAVSHVLERIHHFYFQSELRLDLVTEALTNDAVSLLYVIRDGLEADEKRRKRIRERKYEPVDFQPPPEV